MDSVKDEDNKGHGRIFKATGLLLFGLVFGEWLTAIQFFAGSLNVLLCGLIGGAISAAGLIWLLHMRIIEWPFARIRHSRQFKIGFWGCLPALVLPTIGTAIGALKYFETIYTDGRVWIGYPVRFWICGGYSPVDEFYKHTR